MEFPSTIMNPDYPLEETPEDTSISSKFEDGSVQARQKYTRSRTTFSLEWSAMPTAQKTILDDFVKNQAKFQAVNFTWTHPETGVSYDVYIKKDSYTAKLTSLSYWNVSLELVEV